ncbi:hypothetical protein Tco_0215220 [Tanacetum coccineum]
MEIWFSASGSVRPASRQERRSLTKLILEGQHYNLVKGRSKNSVFLQYQMDECHKLVTTIRRICGMSADRSVSTQYSRKGLSPSARQITELVFDASSQIACSEVRMHLGVDRKDGLGESLTARGHGNKESGQRDDKRRSKTSHCNSRKDWQSTQPLDTYPILLSFTHCGNKSILRVLRIILVILPEHPSETIVFHNEDGNPARANIKSAKDILKMEMEMEIPSVKASANSDVMYSFTSAQDGDPLQDDVRLCLDDDLKKAQDYSLRQA